MKKSLLLTLVSLLVFNAVAWGDCTQTLSDITISKNAITWDDKTEDRTASFKISKVVFKTSTQSGKLVTGYSIQVLEQIDGVWTSVYTSDEKKQHTVTLSGNNSTVRFLHRGNYIGYFTGITAYSNSESLVIPNVIFDKTTSTAEQSKTLSINYSATSQSDIVLTQVPSLNCFSIYDGSTKLAKNATVVKSTCDKGTKNLTVKFKATAIGEYSDIAKFTYNGQEITVQLTGYVCPTLAAPAFFTVSEPSYTSVKGEWATVAGAQGYRIVNNLNGSYQNINGGNTSSAIIGGLMPDTEYSFTIYPTVNGAPSINGKASGNIKTLKTKCPNQEFSDITLGDKTWGGFNYSEKTSDKTTTKHQPVVSFDYEVSNVACTGVEFKIYEKVGGSWIQKWSSSSHSGSNVSVALSRGVSEIRFAYKGNFAGYFKKIQIAQTPYIEVSTNKIDFGNVQMGGTPVSKPITVNYSSIPAIVESSNDQFVPSPTAVGADNCDVGSQPVTITFTPTDLGAQSGILTIGGNQIEMSATVTLPIPTNFTANPSYRDIELGWSAISGADGYYLTNKTTGDHIELGKVTSYKWDGLNMNTEYTFSVQARVGTVYSDETTVKSTTKSIAAPEISASSIGYDKATLNWTKINDADKYELICEALDVDTIIKQGEFSVTVDTLLLHHSYTYTIYSMFADNTRSLGSNSVTFTTNDLPASASFSVSNPSYTSVMGTWAAIPDATGYKVVASNGAETIFDGGNTTSGHITGLMPSTTYTFTVYGIYNGVVSLNSTPSSNSATTLETNCPVQEVSNKTLGSAVQGFKWGWDYEFNVEKNSPILSFSYTVLAGVATTWSGNLFEVFEYVNGKWSDATVWNTNNRSGSITNIQLSRTATKVRLRCNGNFGCTFSGISIMQGLYLESLPESLDFGTAKVGQSVDAKTVSVNYSTMKGDVVSGNEERFKTSKSIVGTDDCGYGVETFNVTANTEVEAGTYESKITVGSQAIPTKIKIEKLSATNVSAAATGKSAVSVQWNNVAGATGYKLTCAAASINVTISDTGSEHYSYNATGLDENTQYTFTITTMYNAIENESASASATTYSTVKVEKAGAFAETTTFTLSGVEGQWNKDENSFASGSTATINASNSNVCAKFDKLTIGETEYTTLPQAFIVNAPATATIYYTAKELDAPVVTVNCGSKNSAELSWSAVECADSYTVYVNGVEAETGITATSYTATDLTPATDYTFVVKAVSGSLETASESATATTYGVIKVQVGGDATSTTDWTLTGEAGKWNETEESFEVGSNVSVLASNSDAGVIFDKIQYYGGESTINPTSITVLNASVAETWVGIYYKYNGVAKTDDGQVFPTLNDAVEYSKTHEVSEVTLLTDRPTENLDLTSGSKLILNGNGFKIGDVTVESGAKLTTSGALIMGNLNIKTEYRNSGEVDPNGQNLDVMGTVSFDKVLDPSGKVNSSMWYAVCVPFEVKVSDIRGLDEEGNEHSMVWDKDYIVDEYDGTKRAATGKGWFDLSANSILTPGKMYIVAAIKYNTWRFYKTIGSPIVSDLTSIPLSEFESSNIKNQGWNAIGNSQIFHVDLNTETEFGQVLVNGKKTYDIVKLSEESFAVAAPLFIQYASGSKDVNLTMKSHSSLRSVSVENKTFNLRITGFNSTEYADQLFLTASEYASADYVIGKDLVKMGDLTGVSDARIWMKAKSANLCVMDAKLIDGVTVIPLGIYVPKSGNYEFYLNSFADGVKLELLYNGEVIHNFADGSFSTALAKGSSDSYSLKVSVDADAPVVTDADEVEGVEAYITENILYIKGLNSGAEYTVHTLQNKIASGVADGGIEKVVLPAQGVYIVVSGDTTIKLLNK